MKFQQKSSTTPVSQYGSIKKSLIENNERENQFTKTTTALNIHKNNDDYRVSRDFNFI